MVHSRLVYSLFLNVFKAEFVPECFCWWAVLVFVSMTVCDLHVGKFNMKRIYAHTNGDYFCSNFYCKGAPLLDTSSSSSSPINRHMCINLHSICSVSMTLVCLAGETIKMQCHTSAPCRLPEQKTEWPATFYLAALKAPPNTAWPFIPFIPFTSLCIVFSALEFLAQPSLWIKKKTERERKKKTRKHCRPEHSH